jgi:hypothetical protein
VIDEETGYVPKLGVESPRRHADRSDAALLGEGWRRRHGARRAAATSRTPVAEAAANIHIGIDFHVVSFGHVMLTAGASSCWAVATRRWTAAGAEASGGNDAGGSCAPRPRR